MFLGVGSTSISQVSGAVAVRALSEVVCADFAVCGARTPGFGVARPFLAWTADGAVRGPRALGGAWRLELYSSRNAYEGRATARLHM